MVEAMNVDVPQTNQKPDAEMQEAEPLETKQESDADS